MSLRFSRDGLSVFRAIKANDLALTCAPASMDRNKQFSGAFPRQVMVKLKSVCVTAVEMKDIIVSLLFGCLPSVYTYITCCFFFCFF